MLHHANRASLITTRDPNFRNVTLLLHGDGTNGGQNNTFIDGSTNNFTITRNGNATQGTFSPYGTLWSNYFDGNGDYLTAPADAAFAFGTGSWTVEAWVYVTTLQTILLFDTRSSVSTAGIGCTIWSDGTLYYSGSANNSLTTSAITANTWNHVAWVYDGTTLSGYINGVRGGTATPSFNITQNNGVVGRVGFSASAYMLGYVSNLRVVKGTAVYSGASFTVPTTPLTAVSGTSLLTCQSNRFIDNSSNAFTITRNGDVRVQRFNPFNPPGEYSTSIIGGSGYFDGNADFLTAPSNAAFTFGTGDLTVEAWIYPIAAGTAASYTLLPIVSSDGSFSPGQSVNIDLFYDVTGGNVFTFDTYLSGAGAGVSSSTYALKFNSWTHIAVVRSSGVVTFYANGVNIGGSSFTNNLNTQQGLNVGVRYGGSAPKSVAWYATMYTSNIRIVKSAVYTGNFTPPTAPLTAITNTSLLLNFTNAAIIDSAAMQVPETVGNAQISTSVRRFGTGSLAFDGTGDWLLMPHAPDQFFGTGNFTVEMWLYLATTGAARGLVAKGTSTTGWLVSTNASNQVVFTFGTSTITSTGAISGTTWTHIAVVREGTGTNQTKIYINGTNDGTGTVSTNFNQTNAMYVGADRTAGSALNGNIDDLRITNGIARYTANFTPPTVPFPNM